jgi:hypothetical protein
VQHGSKDKKVPRKEGQYPADPRASGWDTKQFSGSGETIFPVRE